MKKLLFSYQVIGYFSRLISQFMQPRLSSRGMLLLSLLLLSACQDQQAPKNSQGLPMKIENQSHKLVIAHRGASGYLPEHSLAAKAMAHAMNADYIEQDVVMTKDDRLVVLHDPYLDRVTDVMEVFPTRFRIVQDQKRWLAIDFTLNEIKQLNMSEGFSVDSKTQMKTADYPSRFPLFKSSFKVATLEEEIELIQGLNFSREKDIGVYVEIKAPWFHLNEGKDISRLTLKILGNYGYRTQQDKAFVQCFDPDETKRIKTKLMPELNLNLKLVQLIAETSWNETMRMVDGQLVAYDYQWMFEPGAMAKIAEYADAIGPWKPMIVSDKSTADHLIISDMVSAAHQNGLQVHPYTFRQEPSRIPAYAQDFEQLLDIFLFQVGVDGVFTDFPDRAVAYIDKKEKIVNKK